MHITPISSDSKNFKENPCHTTNVSFSAKLSFVLDGWRTILTQQTSCFGSIRVSTAVTPTNHLNHSQIKNTFFCVFFFFTPHNRRRRNSRVFLLSFWFAYWFHPSSSLKSLIWIRIVWNFRLRSRENWLKIPRTKKKQIQIREQNINKKFRWFFVIFSSIIEAPAALAVFNSQWISIPFGIVVCLLELLSASE